MSSNFNDHKLDDATYSSQNIKVLKGLEAVRVRPGMYIGNTDDGSGLHHMIYELTDNSVDEALAGFCSRVTIKLYSDGTASVEDDGRGIPIDIHKEEGVSAAQVIMTQLHAGGKFDQDTYKVSGGLHGVGVSVVNALSHWLELVIARNGKHYFMRFHKGEPEAPLTKISLEEYTSLGIEAEKSTILNNKKSGTYIRFLPDSTIFSHTTFSFSILKERYKELSFLNPGLTFELIDMQKENPQTLTFHDTGGVASFVRMNAKNHTPLLDQVFVCKAEKNGIELDIGILWSSSFYDDQTLCFTNNIPQKEGGTHLQGFRTGLTKVMQKFIPESKMKGLTYSGEDAREGIFAVISAKVPNPRFASQTKEKLVSTEVRPVIEQAITESLSRWLEENPHYAKLIGERIIESIKAKEAARKARELVRKNKSQEIGISAAGKLADCSSKNPALRELFLVEGQSAGGTAKMARNRETQAVLALQGKLLNVEKAILSKILQYEAVRLLITVLGTGIGLDCLPADCKYHKIIIMTDADVDGSHIRALLLTLLFRYMKPLIEAGYVYVSRPPLYAIKSKKHPTIYLKNDTELDDYLIEHVGNSMTLTQNNKQIDNKEEFYRLARQTNQELKQFKALTHDFLTSKTAISMNPADLHKHLENQYEQVSIEVEEDYWHITFGKYDKQRSYQINTKPLSPPAQQFLMHWAPMEVRMGSKLFQVDSLLDFIELTEKLQTSAFEISRFKGLGEMNPKELRETGIDPTTRIIEQVLIDDFDDTDYMVKLLMGDDVPLRRKYIEDNALNAVVDL